MTGSFVLRAVFLVVTGFEALYADLGHFGPSWYRHRIPQGVSGVTDG